MSRLIILARLGWLPSHPELLDYLAIRFMENDWSIKSMIREIVLSRTYRMSSEFESGNYSQDPENKFLWRANPRRLDAEAIRDSVLAASGALDLTRPRGSVVSEVGDARIGIRVNEASLNKPSDHRSVYLPVVRDAVPEALGLFDFAEAGCGSWHEGFDQCSVASALFDEQFFCDGSRQTNGGHVDGEIRQH